MQILLALAVYVRRAAERTNQTVEIVGNRIEPPESCRGSGRFTPLSKLVNGSTKRTE
jgi:hypothetical protein